MYVIGSSLTPGKMGRPMVELFRFRPISFSFSLAMAGAGPTFSQAKLKRKIDSVSKDIYFIDLKLQKIRQSGGNSGD